MRLDKLKAIEELNEKLDKLRRMQANADNYEARILLLEKELERADELA